MDKPTQIVEPTTLLLHSRADLALAELAQSRVPPTLPELSAEAAQALAAAEPSISSSKLFVALWLCLAGYSYREVASVVGYPSHAPVFDGAGRHGLRDLCSNSDRVVRSFREIATLATEEQLARLRDPDRCAEMKDRDLAIQAGIAFDKVRDAERGAAATAFGDALGKLAETLAQGGKLELAVDVRPRDPTAGR